MQKRNSIMLLILTMIFILSGCYYYGNETYETEQNETTTTTSVKENFQKQTQQTTVAPNNSTPVFAEKNYFEVVDITYTHGIENGFLTFHTDDAIWLYNIAENKMYKLTTYDYLQYVNNKIAVVNDDIFVTKVINIETGEVIISESEDEDIDIEYEYFEDTILVKKFEESFSGNITSYGIIGTNGEWLYELSDKYSFDGSGTVRNVVGGIVVSEKDNKKSMYSFKTDTTNNYDGNVDIGCMGTDIYLSVPRDSLKHIDGYTEETTVIYENNRYLGLSSIGDSYIFFRIADEERMFEYNVCGLNRQTLEPLNVDMPGYEVTGYWILHDDIRVFTILNPDGVPYIAIVDNDGNILFDPIKKYADYTEYNYCYFVGNSFINIYGPNKDKYFILNCDTGAMITHEDLPYNFNISPNRYYDAESGLFCIEYDDKYYLIDINDPYYLINPFERANGY